MVNVMIAVIRLVALYGRNAGFANVWANIDQYLTYNFIPSIFTNRCPGARSIHDCTSSVRKHMVVRRIADDIFRHGMKEPLCSVTGKSM